jgi:hypothetical protein
MPKKSQEDTAQNNQNQPTSANYTEPKQKQTQTIKIE